MMDEQLKQAALDFHEFLVAGKVSVMLTKSLATQKDLALAYSPRVAAPCMEIHANPQDAYRYTAKGNLVAVISNGTAVLGLGNIGALDCGASTINEEMKMAARPIADLAAYEAQLAKR